MFPLPLWLLVATQFLAAKIENFQSNLGGNTSRPVFANFYQHKALYNNYPALTLPNKMGLLNASTDIY